ncbi:hypothetical protein ACRRTK_018467 [Alexandromys fortis]
MARGWARPRHAPLCARAVWTAAALLLWTPWTTGRCLVSGQRGERNVEQPFQGAFGLKLMLMASTVSDDLISIGTSVHEGRNR